MTFRRGAAAISVGNAVSKALGVCREVLFAYALGTGPVADAFRLALSLVLIPTHFVTGELSLASAVPVIRRVSLASPDRGRRLARQFAVWLLVYGVVLALVLILAAGPIVSLFAPGFDAGSQALARRFLRVFGVASPLYTLTSAFLVVGVAGGEFGLTAVKPVVQNAGLLLGLFCFLLFRQQQLLAWGFVFGYLVLSVTGLADLRRATSATGFEKDPGAGGLSEGREIREQMWALSFLITITQCGLVGERIITTLAGPGSVAAIDYARFVTETPTLLFAMPAAVVLLSKFSGGEWGDHSEQSTRLCRTLIYVTLPFAVGALTAAPLVVSVVFERGAFGKASAGLVAAALSGSALGVVTGSLAYVVQRVFSARQRNRDLLVGLTTSTVASLGLALLLVRSQGVVVIGVASSLGQGIYAVWGLHRLGILPGFRSAMIPILCCSGVGALAWIGLRAIGAPGLSPWVLLLPACATAACLFAFRAVRSDVAWALPVVRRLRGVPRIPIG